MAVCWLEALQPARRVRLRQLGPFAIDEFPWMRHSSVALRCGWLLSSLTLQGTPSFLPSSSSSLDTRFGPVFHVELRLGARFSEGRLRLSRRVGASRIDRNARVAKLRVLSMQRSVVSVIQDDNDVTRWRKLKLPWPSTRRQESKMYRTV